MAERYETTRSRGETPLKLIFLEGTWERLPFEVRLSRAWYGSEVYGRTGITANQQSEIARRGYCITQVEPVEIDQPGIGNFKSRAATSRILIPILGATGPVEQNCSECRLQGQSVDELSREPATLSERSLLTATETHALVARLAE
jgi:hypothetical protein